MIARYRVMPPRPDRVIRGPTSHPARDGSPARVTKVHPPRRHAPAMAATKYEFRIRARLSEPILDRFDMLEPDLERVETILHGPVRDQAELHGIIERVQSLGLELIEVRRLPDCPPGRESCPGPTSFSMPRGTARPADTSTSHIGFRCMLRG